MPSWILTLLVKGALADLDRGRGFVGDDARHFHACSLKLWNYRVEIIYKGSQEAYVRALMLQGFSENGLHLTALESENIEESNRVEVIAELNAEGSSDSGMEQIVGRLSLEPVVTAARWRVAAA